MTLRGGIWINAFPIDLRDTGRKTGGFPWYRKRTLYEYTADPCNPPTFCVEPHTFIQPDKHFFTDMGSVPEALQAIVPKDLHLPSFILHDSACGHKGLWYADALQGPYIFRRISSREAARLLGMSLYAAGYRYRADLVYRAVRRFGPQFDGQGNV